MAVPYNWNLLTHQQPKQRLNLPNMCVKKNELDFQKLFKNYRKIPKVGMGPAKKKCCSRGVPRT